MHKIPYGRQHITQEDIQAVTRTLQSDWLTQGPMVEAFEKEFAKYTGAQFAVAVSNGTAALHLAALSLGLKPGQKVITTPITFAASANCVHYCGAETVFTDIDPDTALLDIEKVRTLIEQHPKGTFAGIIPVDFAGYPVNMEAFRELADEHGLWLIEDACHAPGGAFTDSNNIKQNCGNGAYADLAIFSFHPVKHIACGEGGMITTNDPDLYEKLILLRTHGITKNPDLLLEKHGDWYYEMQTLGYNYRLPDLNCALGLSQLKRADAGIARRIEIAKVYDEVFRFSSLKTLAPLEATDHAYHLYIIKTKHRKALYQHLKSVGIYTQVHYIPVHTMPYYQNLGWRKGMFPEAEAYYEQCLSLPMYPSLTHAEQNFIIEQIKSFFYATSSNYSRTRWEQKNTPKEYTGIYG
ncbi:UDP-4-amino-4,6-dideoxy-N-acetyl-beta-L-altrosamine transaminase [Saprospiraceae bacterium]|nr:UDP-4-amino-4,6-dideoxy-N-acetyl-beta-L-altrosamine transaminase [Bacteroidota bacterium]MDB4727950.1 UDP-4-amino-4,6-dideoxy-N-acetyl-beta-L-altrosamine transaminase [Saprospiraceae bacterium]MDF1867019.1 UDP-4-amino-4,6-dideoxy-N-acetyl-beta-L-altrosamine transaminase [Saprospiraceae bacterium]